MTVIRGSHVHSNRALLALTQGDMRKAEVELQCASHALEKARTMIEEER